MRRRRRARSPAAGSKPAPVQGRDDGHRMRRSVRQARIADRRDGSTGPLEISEVVARPSRLGADRHVDRVAPGTRQRRATASPHRREHRGSTARRAPGGRGRTTAPIDGQPPAAGGGTRSSHPCPPRHRRPRFTRGSAARPPRIDPSSSARGRALAQQRRGRLLEHPAPGRQLLALALDLVEHVAHAAGRDLDPVALCDRLVAVVVARELQRHRLEAVLGDLAGARGSRGSRCRTSARRRARARSG